MNADSDKISISRKALDKLVTANKRHIRLSGGSLRNGQGEIVEALAAVAREIADADLRAELEVPTPAPVPAEEEVKS